MDLFDLSGQQRADLRAAVRSAGLDESYQSFVARHLDADDARWRWCCGSNCDPCVHTLGRAVDQARQTLGIYPPGLSDDGDQG